MAGETADAYASRKRENAAEGDLAMTTVLGVLPRDQWRVLHDVPWPGRPRAVIDHVVVGPGGVFVIASKNWSGAVAVRDGVLRQDKYSRQGVVTGAVEAAGAVARLLRTVSCPVTPVLCLVRDDTIVSNSEGVLICSSANIVDLLRSRAPVLAELQVQRLALVLADHRSPVMAAVSRGAHRRTKNHRVRYLVGALVALVMTATLVVSPDLVIDAVEDVASLVADLAA